MSPMLAKPCGDKKTTRTNPSITIIYVFFVCLILSLITKKIAFDIFCIHLITNKEFYQPSRDAGVLSKKYQKYLI
jgi:hypothetical protein